MKYHELITLCNRVCNGVDKSSDPITKQMCMNYIHLAIRRCLKYVHAEYAKYNSVYYRLEELNTRKIVKRYRKLLWDN